MSEQLMDAVRERMRGVVLHDLARPPKGWDYSLGDYVLNEDGTKKCADDCRGCALEAALDRVETELADLRAADEAHHLAGALSVSRYEAAKAEAARLTDLLDGCKEERQIALRSLELNDELVARLKDGLRFYATEDDFGERARTLLGRGET